MDRYIRYERAGDQFVGRVVSGLSLNSKSFADLPPFFVSEEKALIATEIAFPLLFKHERMRPVLIASLASVIYQLKFLKDFLKDHKLFKNPLFQNNDLIADLQKIVTNDPLFSKCMPSGILPHVGLLCGISDLSKLVDMLPEKILTGVDNILEDKGAIAGNITREFLKETIQKSLSAWSNICQTSSVHSQETEEKTTNYFNFYRNGRFYRTPENFHLPECDLFTALSLWLLGDTTNNIPPYRSFDFQDFDIKKERKKFSEWKTVMEFIKNSIIHTKPDLWHDKPSLSQLTRLYEEIKPLLHIEAETERRRKRRPGQLHLTSILKLVRARKRQRTK